MTDTKKKPDDNQDNPKAQEAEEKDQAIPKHRFDEVNDKYKEAQEELAEIKAKAKELEEKDLSEKEEWKTLADKKAKDTQQIALLKDKKDKYTFSVVFKCEIGTCSKGV